MRAPFAPLVGDSAVLASRVAFSDPVVLLREPYRIVFAYAGADGVWKNSWRANSAGFHRGAIPRHACGARAGADRGAIAASGGPGKGGTMRGRFAPIRRKRASRGFIIIAVLWILLALATLASLAAFYVAQSAISLTPLEGTLQTDAL
ncbi:hypothetical protein KXV85_005626, partial [Aspergillus fumigatus]